MKDLTHYFMDVEKSPETPKVTNGASNPVKPEGVTPKKRGRVKIKISQKDNEERMCDIVESKHDLVDKTPSPFTVVKEKVKEIPGETPKRPGVRPNELEIEDCDSDDGGDIFSPPERKTTGKNGKILEAEGSKKLEGSNAFQVLMTRSKPVQYLPPKAVSPEEEAAEVKKTQETKMKMKQNKEKLTALADKKGYSKRKLAEAEEAEKIEKRLENRAKVFKRMKRDEEPGNQNQRSSGGLHNYFSKMTPEDREKEKLLALSTVVVKAEIHGCELGKDQSRVIIKPKIMTNAAKSKTRKVLAAIDDIQVLRSETPSPPPVEAAPPEPPVPVSRPKPSKKPKWSLRINLSGAEDSLKDEDMNTEDINIPEILPKSKKKKTKDKSKKSPVPNDLKKPEEPQQTSPVAPTAPETPPDSPDDSIAILDPPESSKKLEKLRRSDSAPLPTPKKDDEPMELIHMHSQPIPDLEITEVKVQKLAPLFIKRQKPDPEVLAARKSFLHSRSPENPNKKKEKKAPAGPSILPFPSISHITQHSPSKTPPSPPKVPSRVPFIYTPSFTPSDFKSLNTTEVSKPQKTSKKSQKPQKSSTEEILIDLESRCPEARELWTAISSIKSTSEPTKESPKRRGRKRKSLEKNPPLLEAEKHLEDVVWTQKYRPLSAKQIVGNEDAAMKLKTWLEAWQSSGKEDYSSSEEFYSSDNSCQNLETNQVAVLLGPHGSGKTASVYAVAEELGYTVLELNASSRRPGKKILKDFEEATKSHRIKKTDSSSQTFLKDEKIPQNSLILVEDVDLVFDEDEGFVSATCQLASNTKRPIVMTCRGACAHLNRLAPQQIRIYYQGMGGDRVGVLLELITLAEAGTRLPNSCVERLLSKGDLRRAVLQLQYLVLSGAADAGDVPGEFGETLWQDVKSWVYKPAVKSGKKLEKKRKEKIKDLETPDDLHADVLGGLADDLDTISLFSNFVEIDDRVLSVSEVKFEPSLSLLENEDLYSSNDSQMMEISQWLRDRVINKDIGKDEKSSSNRFLLMKKELNFGVNLALSQVTSNNLDGYSVRTDYLPTVRTICRAEELKINNNCKRGNRFFHYLQNLRLPSASTKSNVLTAACKILRDDDKSSEV